VIHDDIKLENLLMESSEREDEYNRVKICDFGLSHICDPHNGKAKVEVRCGTQGYIAPEV
jgi:serine/threonine protein kinase